MVIIVNNEQNPQDIINNMYAAHRSRKHIRNLSATITEFLKYCRKRKVTTLLPENLEIPHGASNKGKTVLQPTDLVTLFSVDTVELYHVRKPEQYINAYRFQVLTGLRPGELVGLRWSDINENFIKIQRSINYFGEETKGKNENAIRGFILSDLAVQVLENQKKICPTKRNSLNQPL